MTESVSFLVTVQVDDSIGDSDVKLDIYSALAKQWDGVPGIKTEEVKKFVPKASLEC